jgi:hypothetical protein
MNRNWKERYHKESSLQNIQERDESSSSDSEEYQVPSELTPNQNPRSHQFSLWLSRICYAFAISILVLTFYDWSTTTDSQREENIEPTIPTFNEAEEISAEFEPCDISQLNIEEGVQQIIAEPAREAQFQERLQSLYLVILGAVAGYLQAIRIQHP